MFSEPARNLKTVERWLDNGWSCTINNFIYKLVQEAYTLASVWLWSFFYSALRWDLQVLFPVDSISQWKIYSIQ